MWLCERDREQNTSLHQIESSLNARVNVNEIIEQQPATQHTRLSRLLFDASQQIHEVESHLQSSPKSTVVPTMQILKLWQKRASTGETFWKAHTVACDVVGKCRGFGMISCLSDTKLYSINTKKSMKCDKESYPNTTFYLSFESIEIYINLFFTSSPTIFPTDIHRSFRLIMR